MVEVDSTHHKDKRKNIPTEELRDFVKEDEVKPETILYPRDPSLDPQLVWKGKDEQDSQDLEVPAIPIYIQEKIHPQVIIDDLRAISDDRKPQTANLFANFNGIEDFDKKVDFYHHDQNWSNRMILGDSLLVMNSLAEKEGLKGKVQMIYIDPPYGIKFASNWQVSTRKRNVTDGKAEDATRQPEQIKAYRDTWNLGINSYLSYMRDRLVIGRDLLTETGSIMVQISDENVHLVRCLMDEVFGTSNQIATIAWKKASPEAKVIRNTFNYLLWYCRDSEHTKARKLFRDRVFTEGTTEDPKKLALWGDFPNSTTRTLTTEEKRNPWALPDETKVFRIDKVVDLGVTDRGFPIHLNGEEIFPGTGYSWRGDQAEMKRLVHANRISITSDGLGYKFYLSDYPAIEITNLWEDTAGRTPDMVYVVQTSNKIIERCILMTTDPGDLVLDPTCGGGTTAFVAEQWGRRWITIDTSRVALALARTRLMAAKYPYYLLSDSDDGMKKEYELTGIKPSDLHPTNDIRRGFVYQRVPHITLKSIAHNEEIDTIHAKWQEKLEPIHKKLNQTLNQKWEEWEIPRKANDKWGKDAKELHLQWWDLRRKRQKEIDDSIAHRADTEILYDKPYVDNKRLRVTGPFTMESISPHRMLSVEEKKERAEGKDGWKTQVVGPDQFALMIMDNLKKSGVQNTYKNERLKFDTLEPFAGEWISAAGEYSEKDGATRRTAVCIGPEYGTVGPDLVKEAAKEAVKGVGFDLLIVCGFAFDPHVYEEAKRYGKLTVLMSRMNNDLSLGDDLLKKTGAGNLFMVFGEPDLNVTTLDDGKITIEIKGLDVYDPTTGEIRNSSTDDIACWFIDTDYNEESFFVRHAYFCGDDKPYDKLKRALRALVDEEAWSSLYSTISRPFEPPSTGKIAVKVINHYGDEVLRVYDISK